MTKPTGRPRGRPKIKEYETLMARVPLELVEQARKYAARKQRPISEVLRDGLLLLLEQEDTAPLYVYDRNTSPVKMSDTKEATLPLDTLQPAKVSDTNEDISPRETPPVKMSDTKEADTLPSFDQARFYLGRLCPKGHKFPGTEQSLLRKHNMACRECENASKREKRAREKAQATAM